MPDVVIYADTVRSPELRHEVPIGIGDAFLYVERNGSRHVVIGSLDAPQVATLGGYEIHPPEEFGIDELRRSGLAFNEVLDELTVRAVRGLGVEQALVPASFPLLIADRLRDAGVELTPDRELFEARRRVKSGAELAGVRRAQAGAEAGMAAARDLLRAAETNADGGLELGGAPLTSERIKAAIAAAFLECGCTADEFVVAHGAQAAIGHHLGTGQIFAGEPIVIDLWPRDNDSSCSADMTRTFVVGEIPDELAGWHRLCLQVLDRAVAEARPGVLAKTLYDGSCEIFEGAGQATQRTKPDGEVLEQGFFHSLGHGVGLEVHEAPLLGMTGHEPLVAGDVLAIEPGLYRPGFGGCRIEDLVLVTDDGAERLTSFPYDLAV